MASLQGNAIKDTYKSLLKVADNGELEATAQEITDGNGNGTGVSLNTSGDVTATGTVAFGSLKDTGENITITKFVDEADGISNNDNDSTIPTSAAVRDYVDSNITAQDLDISDGTNSGSVDLDSQSLIFTGDAGVSATVSGQTLTLDSSALQNQIDSNDGDITTLQAADVTLQNNIDSEESARISADTNLQNQINSNDGDISGLDGRLVTAENKLATIETNADVTDVTNVTTALNSISVTELNDVTSAGSGAIITTNERNKLAGIEAGAEVNPTAGEIKTLYESNADTNAFTDAQLNKLNGIESGAEVNTVDSVNTQTGAVVLDADDISDAATTNKFTTQAEIDKLAGIESGAQVNTVDSVNGATGVVVLDPDDLNDTTTVNKFTTQAEIDKLAGIEAGAEVNIVDSVNSQTGVVVLDADDIDDTSTTNKFTTQTDIDKLAGIEALADVTDATNVTTALGSISVTAHSDVTSAGSGQIITTIERDKLAGIAAGAEVNTVDSVNTQTGAVVLDADDIDDTSTTNKFVTSTDVTKLGHITVTQAVDLDTMESDIANLQSDKYDKTGGTISGSVTVTGDLSATNLGGTLSTAAQPNVTSVGTLSSLAVSGNLTVDTDTLYVDASNNRVGVGISSGLEQALDVDGSINLRGGQIFASADGSNTFFANAIQHIFRAGSSGSFAERVRIDSSGNVLIQNSDARLRGGDTTGRFIASNSDTTSYISMNGSANADPHTIALITNSHIAFLTGSPSSTIRARIDDDGLKFGADTAAANALDDYEEGTWTMGIAFDGASAGVTYSFNTGTYTKIGRQVTVTGRLLLSSKGSSTGGAAITGLPFTIANSQSNYSAASLWIQNITFANQYNAVGAINDTRIGLEEVTELGVGSVLTHANFANNSDIILSFTYFV
jgi:hypothetical protein